MQKIPLHFSVASATETTNSATNNRSIDCKKKKNSLISLVNRLGSQVKVSIIDSDFTIKLQILILSSTQARRPVIAPVTLL